MQGSVRDCLGRYILVQSVWCRPGLHEWLIPKASQVVGIGQLRCTSLDPFHRIFVRYRRILPEWVRSHCQCAQPSSGSDGQDTGYRCVCVGVCVCERVT